MSLRPKVAVIPVAGRGTRWMPISRSVPKELLPVWRRTSASYAFEEAIRAGIEDVIFVISPEKHDVLEHFQHFDASDLGETFKGESSDNLHRRIHVSSCIQEEARGLGHAILCAEERVAGRPFAVLLPDEVLFENGLSLLMDAVPSVLLMDVPYEQRACYGMVDLDPNGGWIRDLVEKPKPECAPSSLAITGRYTFTAEIFDFLRTQAPGHHGEIQLTDAMKRYTREYSLRGVVYRGIRYDVGQPLGLLEASLNFALRDPEYRERVQQVMREMIAHESFVSHGVG